MGTQNIKPFQKTDEEFIEENKAKKIDVRIKTETVIKEKGQGIYEDHMY